MAMVWSAALAIGVALLAGCGGGTDATKAQVRMVNASAGYKELDLRVQDEVRLGGVLYGASEGYIEIDPGKAASTISSAGSATPLLSFTPSLSEKKHYALLAYGAAGALRQVLLDENTGAPDTGRALLRVVNAAADAGAVDIYLSGSNDLLTDVVAVQTGVAYGQAGVFTTLNSGTWRLRITAAGSKTDVRLDVAAMALPSKHVATLVVTPSLGGAMVNALVLAQQGSITRLDTQQSRVRLAAGVAGSGLVGASVGTTSLVSANAGGAVITAPSLDDYVVVPAGLSAVTVKVNGQALAVTGKTLEAGRDYSFLVRGPLTAPQTDWIDDDNRLPSDAARVKLRLVNGLAEASAVLAMTLDGRPAAGAVAVGKASAYSLVAPIGAGTTGGRLSITAADVTTPLITTPSQILTAGGSYSVFLVGPQAAPTAIVRQDR